MTVNSRRKTLLSQLRPRIRPPVIACCATACVAFDMSVKVGHCLLICFSLSAKYCSIKCLAFSVGCLFLSVIACQWTYMVLDLQSLLGINVHSCIHQLRPHNPFPPHLGLYTGALLVSQDRRHLLVTQPHPRNTSVNIFHFYSYCSLFAAVFSCCHGCHAQGSEFHHVAEAVKSLFRTCLSPIVWLLHRGGLGAAPYQRVGGILEKLPRQNF